MIDNLITHCRLGRNFCQSHGTFYTKYFLCFFFFFCYCWRERVSEFHFVNPYSSIQQPQFHASSVLLVRVHAYELSRMICKLVNWFYIAHHQLQFYPVEKEKLTEINVDSVLISNITWDFRKRSLRQTRGGPSLPSVFFSLLILSHSFAFLKKSNMIYTKVKTFCKAMAKPSPFIVWIKHKQNDSFNWIELRKHVLGRETSKKKGMMCSIEHIFIWEHPKIVMQFDEVVYLYMENALKINDCLPFYFHKHNIHAYTHNNLRKHFTIIPYNSIDVNFIQFRLFIYKTHSSGVEF